VIDTNDLAKAVVAWVLDTCDDIVGEYHFAPLSKSRGLPDVVVEIETTTTRLTDDRFPQKQLQQAAVRAHTVTASIMVAVGDNDDAAQAGAESLRLFGDQLTQSWLDDDSLGARVPFTSPTEGIVVDFVPQFVRYEDGQRGRMMTVTLVVGELIGG
jgi:hypothetical protein